MAVEIEVKRAGVDYFDQRGLPSIYRLYIPEIDRAIKRGNQAAQPFFEAEDMDGARRAHMQETAGVRHILEEAIRTCDRCHVKPRVCDRFKRVDLFENIDYGAMIRRGQSVAEYDFDGAREDLGSHKCAIDIEEFL